MSKQQPSLPPPPRPASAPTARPPVPLSAIVTDAVSRWFDETQQDAKRGEAKQQALLSQMLAEGYGCQQDAKAAEAWAEMARSRGYKMKGVYCEL
jgi:TPR repeat protein